MDCMIVMTDIEGLDCLQSLCHNCSNILRFFIKQRLMESYQYHVCYFKSTLFVTLKHTWALTHLPNSGGNQWGANPNPIQSFLGWIPIWKIMEICLQIQTDGRTRRQTDRQILPNLLSPCYVIRGRIRGINESCVAKNTPYSARQKRHFTLQKLQIYLSLDEWGNSFFFGNESL